MCSRACSMLANSSSRRIGFSMKSAAPARMASTAIGTSPWPVIMMAGSRLPFLLSRCSSSSPPIPGIRAMRGRVKGELGAQLLEHRIDREIDHLASDDPGLELVDVEERVEHARHRAHGLVEPADQLQ